MDAGIKPSDAALACFSDLQSKHKYHYIVFKVDDGFKNIVVDSTQESKEEFSYDKFEELITSSPEPRFGILDYQGKTADGRSVSKIVFIYWSPDSAKIRLKMMYSSAKGAFEKALTGIQKRIQANDPGDLEEAVIRKELNMA